ncbi:MAG: hypothetical protein ACTSQC_01755 [Candidatus Heimdallarchaeaceae archaeon]
MSSPTNIDKKSGRKKRATYSEDDLSKFAAKFDVSYESDKEKLVSDFAIKGQNLLKEGKFDESEEICDFLLIIGKQWRDDFTKMKAFLLKAQLGSSLNQESIIFLSKALSLAKKLKYNEIIVGVRVQLAYEYFHKRELKKVLKQISEIEKYEPLDIENSKVIYELKSRCYWESDDYVNGFGATYKWFSYLKETDDMHSMFIVIVYLLTVVSSLDLPLTKEKINEIKKEIEQVLANLATSPHLFQDLIPHIDTLFAKSLMMVHPEVLYEFTDMFLQTVRWMDEEKYLYSCLKLADAFYNINDSNKAVEIIDKGKVFIKDKKYAKLDNKISLKKIEFTSLIFYFMSFDPLYDPLAIESVKIIEDEDESDYFLQTFYTPINSYASTSYSHFLRILEKTKSNKLTKEKSIRINGLSEDEEREYFVLRLILADKMIDILFREDFQIDDKISNTLHSTVSPFYSIIGILSSEKGEKNTDVKEMENILLEIQRAINCPASIAEIIFPRKHPQLDLLRFSSNEGGFKDLQEKVLGCALSFKHKYPFLNDHNFLQIFQSDPITLFDFSLREPHRLEPLSVLLSRASSLDLTNEILSDLFQDTINLFLQRGDTRYWKDFYYQYAWLHQCGTYLNLPEESFERKSKLADELIFLADKLQEEEKILESRYYRLFLQLTSDSPDYQEFLEDFLSLVKEYKNKKYEAIAKIFTKLFKKEDLTLEASLSDSFDFLCELCSTKDWKKTLELFLYFVSIVPNLSKLLDVCKMKVTEDTGFLIYLNLVKRLIRENQPDSAFSVLKWLIGGLTERKEKFDLPEHTWNYLFVTANTFLYELLPNLDESELEAMSYSRNLIIDNLLENYEWIIDPIFVVKILLEKIAMLLQKSEFVTAESFYSWIEQLMFYHWNIFSSEENKDLIEKIQETKKKIVSQHFT